MDLTKLYEVQQGLKERIDYQGEDKFEKMILAFLVEVGECANDWRGFKYWSKDQTSKQTLLEEYVDGLHFVLEVGLDLQEANWIKYLPKEFYFRSSGNCITTHIKEIIFQAVRLEGKISPNTTSSNYEMYRELLSFYVTLGTMLGFTTNQIEQAYLDKNKVNHERQDNGY